MSGSKMSDPLTGRNAYGLFSNLKLEIYSLFSLAVLGLIFRVFFPQNNNMTGNEGPATSTIWGYGLSIVSLICILFITFGLAKSELMSSKNFDPNMKGGFLNNIKYILGAGRIFVIIIIVLVLILLLNYSYYEKINIGIIPASFNNFNYISNLIMIIQFMILFQYINLTMFKNDKETPITSIIRATTYFLSITNIIFIVIMFILLKYYSTDG